MSTPPAWLVSAVAAADAATQALGLQEEITVERFATEDAYGNREYDSDPLTPTAFVQRKEGVMKTPAGQELNYRAIIGFLRPFALDSRDRITLSDGLTGPILTPHGGLSDPTTGAPYARTVYLG